MHFLPLPFHVLISVQAFGGMTDGEDGACGVGDDDVCDGNE